MARVECARLAQIAHPHMRLPRRIRRFPTRHALAVVALLAQLVVAVGAPLPAARVAKGASAPFPCQNHPCGCSTPEKGWAGDCCCFTLEEKLAWAEARGIEPPAHVRATVEGRKAARLKEKQKAKSACCAKHAKLSCCETPSEPAGEPATASAPPVRWVSGVFVQKCRGDGPAGLLKIEVSIPPAHAPDVRAARPDCGGVAAFDVYPFPTPVRPPIPPPRAS